MDLTESAVQFWLKIEKILGQTIPCHVKNTFHACGYSNILAFKSICDADFDYVEDFTRKDLMKRLSEKCDRLKITLNDCDKKLFFGEFVSNITSFNFNPTDRALISTAVEHLNDSSVSLTPFEIEEIAAKSKTKNHWFCEENCSPKIEPEVHEAGNLLSQMVIASKQNALRPKQGYRYGNDYKRFIVHNRLLSGPIAFKSLQMNLKGCFPSISTTNRYIHRSDHAIVEGELRVDELLTYLNQRNEELWVSLSEDGTKIENRVQYDSRTNQVIGFVLPVNENGMPTSFVFKARSAQEMIAHFARDVPIASIVNTIMAKPMGKAPAFCLLVFGTDNRYTGDDVSNRWNFITSELRKVGIGVLCRSGDGDTRNISAMRKNSGLGNESNDPTGMFKCGMDLVPPFHSQDYPHVTTKLRNLLLKTIDTKGKLPFGKFYIQQSHLRELLSKVEKDVHLLTATDLNPIDRQNYDSALKICDDKVIKLLKQKVNGSEGTIIYLQIMADMNNAFDDRELRPIERVEKLWKSVFLVRMWRQFVLNRPDLTLKDNFMSACCYYCIELNAHFMVQILLYLKKNQLTHLFQPTLFCSQPCESFFRLIRSVSTVNSSVVNFSVKQMLDRISRIQLLNEISNDKDSGFVYLNSTDSSKFTSSTHPEEEFPNQSEIIDVIFKCRNQAFELAKKIGLVERKCDPRESCICRAPPYKLKSVKMKGNSDTNFNWSNQEDRSDELSTKLTFSTIKNFSNKIEEDSLLETSPYVEVFGSDRRLVFKKTSICWLLGKSTYKCSSDRKYRVMDSSNNNTGRLLMKRQRKNKKSVDKKRLFL